MPWCFHQHFLELSVRPPKQELLVLVSSFLCSSFAKYFSYPQAATPDSRRRWKLSFIVHWKLVVSIDPASVGLHLTQETDVIRILFAILSTTIHKMSFVMALFRIASFLSPSILLFEVKETATTTKIPSYSDLRQKKQDPFQKPNKKPPLVLRNPSRCHCTQLSNNKSDRSPRPQSTISLSKFQTLSSMPSNNARIDLKKPDRGIFILQ